MLLVSNDVEFRNVFTKTGKNGAYFIATFEDENGQPFEVYVGSKDDKVRDLVKGEKYGLRFDFDTRYKNLNLVSVC